MPSADNFLNTNCNTFSNHIHEAARHGNLNAQPLIRALEDARRVALGVATVLQMVRNNDVQTYRHETQAVGELAGPPPDAPVCAAMMGSLLELARVASEMTGHRIEDLAEWVEENGMRRTAQNVL